MLELANTIIIVTAWLAMLVSLVDIAFLVFLCKTFSKLIHEIVMLEKSPSNAEQAFLRAADKIKESTKC